MDYLLTVLLFGACFCQDVINNKKFPSDFIFAASTSAYQVEGSWDADGKTPSIWDTTVHNNPSFIKDLSNGDVACDSYNKIKEDVAILKELGVSHYRFSLAWTRILPKGVGGDVNKAGAAYYKNLIKELKDNDISPLVTIFHQDMPQSVYEMGGLQNASFADWYSAYARECFRLFGDDVKYWLTFNEPQQLCTGGYGYGYFPPAVKSEALLEYVCVYNLIKAHAKAWHVYDDEFRSSQQGKISITLDTGSYLPGPNDADKEATDRLQHFSLGIYANPIYVGDYPAVVKERVAARSAAEGRNESRLPDFTEEEIAYIRGTHDFFGLNVYSALVVEALADSPIQNPPNKMGDQGVNFYPLPEWENTTSETTKVVPWSVRPLLNWIKDQYNNPGIIITENGYPDRGDRDDRRLFYIRGYLSEIRNTMIEDGVSVLGYTVWSLMDNFEWVQGYSLKYGLFEVDFNSENRTRTIRPSGKFYKKVATTRCLVDNCEE